MFNATEPKTGSLQQRQQQTAGPPSGSVLYCFLFNRLLLATEMALITCQPDLSLCWAAAGGQRGEKKQNRAPDVLDQSENSQLHTTSTQKVYRRSEKGTCNLLAPFLHLCVAPNRCCSYQKCACRQVWGTGTWGTPLAPLTIANPMGRSTPVLTSRQTAVVGSKVRPHQEEPCRPGVGRWAQCSNPVSRQTAVTTSPLLIRLHPSGSQRCHTRPPFMDTRYTVAGGCWLTSSKPDSHQPPTDHPCVSARSMDGPLYTHQKQEVTLRDLNLEPPSPGTLVWPSRTWTDN